MVDNFFADGEGSEFADRSAMDTAISDLRGLEGQGQIAEGNIVTAQDDLAAFFSGLNSIHSESEGWHCLHRQW